MKNIEQWLLEYGESHQNHKNEQIHWICVPVIFFCVFGFLFLFTIPIFGNLAIPVGILILIYYAALSRTLWIGMLFFLVVCFGLSFYVYGRLQENTVWLFTGLFIAAWIGQFYGHKIEGKKPSFLKDIQFLLIGPAWLMEKIYNKMGISI